MDNKNKLGKGLSALIGDETLINKTISNKKSEPEFKETLIDNGRALVKEIDMLFVIADKKQPRKNFIDESLKELSDSIREKGVLQPIIVREDINNKGRYKIISGERRFRASKIIGLNTIPAIIKNISDNEALEIGIIENLQRENLNPIDEAFAYKDLVNEFGYTQDYLSKKVGKSRAYITNMLRILTLPKPVRKLVQSGDISLGHAKVIVGHNDAEKIAKIIVDKGLSVRETESLIKDKPVEIEKKPKKHHISDFLKAEIEEVKALLSNRLNLRANVKTDGKKGVVEFKFSSLEEFDRLVSILSSK